MNIVKATTKTVLVGIVQVQHNHNLKQAQSNAYKKTCQQARGKYDPFFKEHYQKNLNLNLQKANDKKERFMTFVNNL